MCLCLSVCLSVCTCVFIYLSIYLSNLSPATPRPCLLTPLPPPTHMYLYAQSIGDEGGGGGMHDAESTSQRTPRHQPPQTDSSKKQQVHSAIYSARNSDGQIPPANWFHRRKITTSALASRLHSCPCGLNYMCDLP